MGRISGLIPFMILAAMAKDNLNYVPKFNSGPFYRDLPRFNKKKNKRKRGR